MPQRNRPGADGPRAAAAAQRRREPGAPQRCTTPALLLSLSLAACGGERATRWVPPDAAVVRCTTAGRDRMPPMLLDLPIPSLPTGLLSRQLDPMALNDMGFERDQVVCASLARPSPSALDDARDDVTSLLAAYRQTSAQARRALGTCTCDIARRARVVDMLSSCQDEQVRPRCDEPTELQVQRAQSLVAPLQRALETTIVPRIHWRVAGRTDRPGWFVRRLDQLLPRHSGGVTTFVPGKAIANRYNHALVRRLLDLPGAVAVLRQDGGRTLLVARELDDALILDLLSFPQVAPNLVPLLPYIDHAQADAVAKTLTRPSTARWEPPLDPSKGNLAYVNGAGLRAVDTLRLAMAPFAGLSGLPPTLPAPTVAPLLDAVTLQADFGANGEVLRATLTLSDAGRAWAQGLTEAQLGSQLDQLGLPREPPPLDPSIESAAELLRYYRGPTERVLLGGLQRAAAFLGALEMHHPNSVQGTLVEWDVQLPPGAIAPGGTVPPPLELRGWTERVSSAPYRLRAAFDPPRHSLEMVLSPD